VTIYKDVAYYLSFMIFRYALSDVKAIKKMPSDQICFDTLYIQHVYITNKGSILAGIFIILLVFRPEGDREREKGNKCLARQQAAISLPLC
jgi:hypothetical protein